MNAPAPRSQVAVEHRRQQRVGEADRAGLALDHVGGDRQSYLRQDPDWTPTYGTGGGGGFTMVDLLTAAAVVATIA